MTLSLYEVTFGTFAKAVPSLKNVLEKSVEHAKAKGVDPDTYVTESLHADMLPLSFQIQIISNVIAKTIYRLTGKEVSSVTDNETTMAQLIARTDYIMGLLAEVEESKMVRDDTIVELQLGNKGTMNVPAKDYALNFSVPNVFFHLSTAYGILRNKGVPLGKSDFLGCFLLGGAPTPKP